jgi:hypothetical protein
MANGQCGLFAGHLVVDAIGHVRIAPAAVHSTYNA